MVKRKDFIVSDEGEAAETPSESEEEKPKKKPASKAKATAKKPRYDDDESEEERPMKKQKPEKAKSSKEEEGPSAEIKTNYEGERYVDLGKKKRMTVRSFKGSTFIDIREFYGQEGDEKPGKKGITLSPEQWEAMKSNMDNIDWMLKKLKK